MRFRSLNLARPARQIAVSFGLALIGCFGCGQSFAQQAAASEGDFNDPFENVNRSIFEFNRSVDRIVLVPVAKTYRTVLPEPLRDGLHNILRNLDEPLIFANDLLQGRPDLAHVTFARFFVNSTLGVGGIFDIASRADLPYHNNDLGITFAVWGIGEGPYLMLPILGPSTVRDAIGQGGDAFADPGNIAASENHVMWATFARAGVSGIDTRSRNIESLADIEKTSLDFYATIRSLYRQRRAAEIRHEQPPGPDITPLSGSDSRNLPAISYTVEPAAQPKPSGTPK